MSAILTWILLALIPVVPVVLALFAGDEPRNEEDAAPGRGHDDTRLDDPGGDPRQDDPGGLLMAA